MITQTPFPGDGTERHTTSYNERLDAELDRFNARSRQGVWRNAIYAVLGAVVIVGIGIWGFGIETNTRNAPVAHPPAPSPGPAVMVIIRPN